MGDISDEVNTSTISLQEEMYGEIQPAPSKAHEPKLLPKLNSKLVIPKHRVAKGGGPRTTTTPLRPNVLRKVPMKGRNFSTPLPTRVGSIGDSPIPDLSPLSPTLSGDLLATPSHNNGSPQKTPASVRCFSSPSAALRSGGRVPLQVKLNQLSGSTYAEESERQLQREIVQCKARLDDLHKIKKHRESGGDENLDKDIEKWRNIAQRASNYLLNEAKLKISRMGGIERYRQRQKEDKLRSLRYRYDSSMLAEIEEYMETPQYKALDKYEKQEVADRKREIERMSEKIENGEVGNGEESEDEPQEFTMRELYAQLQLDYNRIYKKMH